MFFFAIGILFFLFFIFYNVFKNKNINLQIIFYIYNLL